jgi:protein SCO1/2
MAHLRSVDRPARPVTDRFDHRSPGTGLAVRYLAVTLAFAAGFAACLAPFSSRADDWNPESALVHSQSAIGRQVETTGLVRSDGSSFDLAELRGKPVVVSLIYTSCHHVCPVITQHLADAVDAGRDALGEQSFSVVTVGFDIANDTPERMAQYARERGLGNADWVFASASEEALADLVAGTGFIFFESPKGFDHLSQISVLDEDGRVYRQIYGQDFLVPALVEPLKELVFQRRTSGGLIDKWISDVRFFCTVYDPASNRYHFDYSLFLSAIIGFMCLGGVAVFIVRAWRDAV